MRASYDDEAETLVAHFIAKGAKSVAVFYQDDGFGQRRAVGHRQGAEEAQHEPSLAKSSFQRNTLAIKAGLAAMVDAKPDAVVMVGTYAPLAAFIKRSARRGPEVASWPRSVLRRHRQPGQPRWASDGEGVVISQVVPFPDDNDLPIQRECREALAAARRRQAGLRQLRGLHHRQGDGGRAGARRRPRPTAPAW